MWLPVNHLAFWGLISMCQPFGLCCAGSIVLVFIIDAMVKSSPAAEPRSKAPAATHSLEERLHKGLLGWLLCCHIVATM